jgi:hypothetical protein
MLSSRMKSRCSTRPHLVAGVILVTALGVLVSAAPGVATSLEFGIGANGPFIHRPGLRILFLAAAVRYIYRHRIPEHTGDELLCNTCVFTIAPGGESGLSGQVDANNDGDFDDPEDLSGTLLSGSIDTVSVTEPQPGTDGEIVLTVSYTADINLELLAYYGLPDLPVSGTVQLTYFGSNYGGLMSSGQLQGGNPPGADMVATVVTSEAASLLLLASGLAGVGLWRRKRVKAS